MTDPDHLADYVALSAEAASSLRFADEIAECEAGVLHADWDGDQPEEITGFTVDQELGRAAVLADLANAAATAALAAAMQAFPTAAAADREPLLRSTVAAKPASAPRLTSRRPL